LAIYEKLLKFKSDFRKKITCCCNFAANKHYMALDFGVDVSHPQLSDWTSLQSAMHS